MHPHGGSPVTLDPAASAFRTATLAPEQALATLDPDALAERLRNIESITDAALAHLTLDDLLRELLVRLRSILAADVVRVLLCTKEGNALAVRASLGLEGAATKKILIPLRQGLAGRVAMRREAVIVDDISRIEVVDPVIRRLRSAMVAPLQVEGELLGVVKVGNLEPRTFHEVDLSLLQIVADRIAVAIDRAHRYEEARVAIREQAEAQAALGRGEERFRLLVESVQDYGIFLLNPSGHVASWNAGAERIKGYAEEEILGQHFSLFYTPEDVERGHPQHELEIAARQGRCEEEDWRVRKDGSRFWANVVITALRDAEGQLIGFAKVTRDLTERKRAGEEREALLARARVARREAEGLAEELQRQAGSLEEQTADLAALNDDLRASRARLQATIDSSLDAIVTTDAKSVILEWSHHAQRLFGWSAEEAIGRDLSETIIPPQYREAHRRGVQRYLTTGEGPILNRRIEITALGRDGREFPVELTVAPAGCGRHVIFNAFIRDLTERKQAERQRSAEHAVTRVLAESHTLGEAAPRLPRAMGEALGWDVGTFWTMEGESNLLHCVALWHAPAVQVPEFASVSRQTSFALGVGLPGRVWERRVPMWVSDAQRDENFPRAAAAAREGLHGAIAFPVLSGKEFLGVIEFFHHEILEPDEALLRSVEVIGSDIAQSIKRVQAEGERDRALRELERINEDLQQANAALAQRTAEAEAASRAKTDFLAVMSHELRTPLNAILGYAELLLLGIPEPISEVVRHRVERMQGAARYQLELIEEILAFAHLASGRGEVEREPVDLGELVRGSVELVLPLAEKKGLRVEVSTPEAPLAVLTDPGKVRQIVANLLSNAVKFTRQGEIRVGVEKEEDLARVRVQDTGIGIAPEHVKKIFEPFWQAQQSKTREAGGTGLGLTLALRTAQLLGGEISVKSTPGEGSLFTLSLPLAPPPEPSLRAD